MRNLKKVIALVAVFAMLVSTVAFAATFDDVAETDNYATAIETLNQLGILTGDDENNDGVMSFRPNDTITRAEITAIVARIQGVTGAVGQTNTIFTDVPSTHWASGYIASATQQGVVNGYGDGTFGPDDNVLYQDVVKMIMETLGYKNYALDNGGYPTGYILAAQRQNVLVGVQGGAEGTEATRGQVAQITNNAIKAPIMDRLAYGGNGQYVIYDGTWQSKKTCLSEYLGITYMRGDIIANAVTDMSGPLAIGTKRNDTVKVDIDDLDNVISNVYYEGYTYDLYVGDTNAADYFGYNVDLYVRNANSDTGTIVSVAEAAGRNTTISFTLDQYSYYDPQYGDIYYQRSETDRSASRLRLASDFLTASNPKTVVYNGIAGYSVDEIFATEGANDKPVYQDTTNSGRVTLIDNNEQSGYDFVIVELATSGVVQELSSRGVVSFKNNVVGDNLTHNNINRIEFASSDVYVNITKDGQPYDYTQLKEWDVLSIVANTDNTQVYKVEVLDSANTAITGTVSRRATSATSYSGSTNASGYAYTINGTEYDLAYGCYQYNMINPGVSGTFYVDQFGKIVAYNRDGSSSGTSDNYAYILNVNVDTSTFGDTVPTVRLLFKDGTVTTAQLGTSVTVYNPTVAMSGDNTLKDYMTFRYDDAKYADNLQDVLVDAMLGRVVTLSASNGIIRSMTLPYNNNKIVDSSTTLAEYANGTADYDEDTRRLSIAGKRTYVDDDTLVFFIGAPGDEFQYGQAASGSKMPVEDCKVTTGASLATIYQVPSIAYTNNTNDGSADVVVMYNSDIASSPNTGVAFITSIGVSTVNGTDVLAVQYYQDGELKDAVTDDIVVGDLNQNTQVGSLFKFGMTGDTITSATPYLTFDGEIRPQIARNGQDVQKVGVPYVTYMHTPRENSGEDVYFGAVLAKNNGRLTIAPLAVNSTVPDLANITDVALSRAQANYYIYDPTRSSRSRCGIGSFGDIMADNTLTGNGGQDTATTITFKNGTSAGLTPAWGMLDYVFVRMYENKADVVDYTTQQYDYR